MAIRVESASSEYLSRSSGLLDHNSPYTIAFWFYNTSDRYHGIVHIGTPPDWEDSDRVRGGEDWMGRTLNLESAMGGSASGAFSSGGLIATAWNHIAMVRTSSTQLRLYINFTLEVTLATPDVSSRTATASVFLGRNQDDYADGRFFGYKEFQRALTLAELTREARQCTPVTAGKAWPFLSGSSRLLDIGGANGWTANGTVSDEDNAPIAWGGDPDPIQFVTVAGGGPSTNTIIPDPGSLTLTGFAPALHTMIPPVPGTLSLTGFVPVLHTALHPAAGALAVTGNAPNIVTDAVLSPDPGALTLTGNTPILGGEQVLQPTPGALTLTGVAPNIVTHTRLSPTPGSLTLTGHAPYAGPPVTFPPNSDINLSGFGLFLRRRMRRQRTV